MSIKREIEAILGRADRVARIEGGIRLEYSTGEGDYLEYEIRGEVAEIFQVIKGEYVQVDYWELEKWTKDSLQKIKEEFEKEVKSKNNI